MIRGPAGCGKSMLVQHVAKKLKCQIELFGIGDFAKANPKFTSSVLCNGFVKSIVVIDGVDGIQNFDKLTQLLATLKGQFRKKRNPIPPVPSNPLILIGSDQYSPKFYKLQQYCESIDMKPVVSTLQRQILQKVCKRHKNFQCMKQANTLIENSGGNVSTLLSQAEFYEKNTAAVKDKHNEFNNIFQIAQNMRWPRTDRIPSQSYFSGAVQAKGVQLLDFLSTNYPDNRTTIDDMANLYETLSIADTMFYEIGQADEFVGGLLKGTVHGVKQTGKRPKMSLPKAPTMPNEKLLLEAAHYNHWTKSQLVERMQRLNEFYCPVFDKKYQQEHELENKQITALNVKLCGCVKQLEIPK